MMRLKHNLNFGRHFSRFKYCDAKLTSDGSRSLQVHRVILASVCTKFQLLFDSNNHSSAPLVVEDVDFDCLEKIIEFIYSGEIVIGDDKTDDLVVEAMKKLQLDLNVDFETIVKGSESDEAKEVFDNNNDTAACDANSCKIDQGIQTSKDLDTSSSILGCSKQEEINDPASGSFGLEIPNQPDSLSKSKLKVRKDLFECSTVANSFVSGECSETKCGKEGIQEMRVLPNENEFKRKIEDVMSSCPERIPGTLSTPVPQPELISKFGGTGSEQGKFCRAVGLAINENRLIFIVDIHRVQVFNENTRFLFQFGTEHLVEPNDIAIVPTIGGTGCVIVSDQGDNSIKVFSIAGQFLRRILGPIGRPVAVSVNGEGTVTVLEVKNESRNVIVCDLYGSCSMTFPSRGHPCFLSDGLLVTSERKIFIPQVGMNGSELVQIYSFSGVCIGSLEFPGLFVGISCAGQDLLVASFAMGQLRLTLLNPSGQHLFSLSSQKIPLVPCSFALFSSSPALSVLVGARDNNIHVLTVRTLEKVGGRSQQCSRQALHRIYSLDDLKFLPSDPPCKKSRL